MMVNSVTLSLLSLLLTLVVNSAGTAHLKALEDICSTGQRQSPINIEENELDGNAIIPHNIKMKDYDVEIGWIGQNDGHTLVVSPLDEVPTLGLDKGPLKQFYKFYKFHFHWRSEHTIDGIWYPVEVHFVHYNSKYENFSVAAEKEDGLAVLGLFLSTDEYYTHDSTPFMKSLLKLEETELLPLSALVGSDVDDWWYYQGSLTTSPCSENVQWIVLKNPSHIDKETLNDLINIENDDGEPITGNFRETQPLNNRTIYTSGANTLKNTFIFLAITAMILSRI